MVQLNWMLELNGADPVGVPFAEAAIEAVRDAFEAAEQVYGGAKTPISFLVDYGQHAAASFGGGTLAFQFDFCTHRERNVNCPTTPPACNVALGSDCNLTGGAECRLGDPCGALNPCPAGLSCDPGTSTCIYSQACNPANPCPGGLECIGGQCECGRCFDLRCVPSGCDTKCNLYDSTYPDASILFPDPHQPMNLTDAIYGPNPVLPRSRRGLFRLHLLVEAPRGWAITGDCPGPNSPFPGDMPFYPAVSYTPLWVLNGGTTALGAYMMHELGHTLGLAHGGPCYESATCQTTNHKPNHFSVMNYYWGSDSVSIDGRLDYSNGARPDLTTYLDVAPTCVGCTPPDICVNTATGLPAPGGGAGTKCVTPGLDEVDGIGGNYLSVANRDVQLGRMWCMNHQTPGGMQPGPGIDPAAFLLYPNHIDWNDNGTLDLNDLTSASFWRVPGCRGVDGVPAEGQDGGTWSDYPEWRYVLFNQGINLPEQPCLTDADCGPGGDCTCGHCRIECQSAANCPSGQDCVSESCRPRRPADVQCMAEED